MKVPEQYRITKAFSFPPVDYSRLISDRSYGNEGAFFLPRQGMKDGKYFLCIVSSGMGWEHVSCSVIGQERCPTWEEMCYIKSVFWDKSECVVEYHPAASEYISCHPFCLHLWRPIGQTIPVPPSIMVGPSSSLKSI